MSKETTSKFADEIDRVINYFRDEFELTYAEAIGVLVIKLTALAAEANEAEE